MIYKIKDLQPGNIFTHEGIEYILVDMNPSNCFIGSASETQTIFCALNMSTYKVNCFMADTEVQY
jgi:hypothetical protein